MKIIVAFIVPILFLVACGKSGSSPATQTTVPSASISDASQQRSAASDTTFVFTVTLSQAAQQNVTVSYTTIDGTAVKNTDYLPASGTLTISAGSTSASINVQVTGDSLRRPNQIFYVQLSNPQNCTLSGNKGTGTIINDDLLYFPVDNTGYTTPTQYPGYTLAWSDEFTGNAINTNNWGFESGNNSGWGNQELENYTARTQNAFVSAGNLIIEARLESLGGFTYTSARMKTEGLQSFQYGRVDIRAKLPAGQGMWPALWMLGNDITQVNWPACGEIDMMELLGQQTNKIYGTLHWGANYTSEASQGGTYTLPTGGFDQQFHVYSLLWDADSLKLLVDDQQYFSLATSAVSPGSPFNNKFFFIFNIAVGGNWPGAPNGTTQFPQRMVVDYIRVFQK